MLACRWSRLGLLCAASLAVTGVVGCGEREALYRPGSDAGAPDATAPAQRDGAVDRPAADRSVADRPAADRWVGDRPGEASDADVCAPAASALGGGLCHHTVDCAYPDQCLDFMTGTGSCWPHCRPELSDPATLHNPDCAADELCIGEGEPTYPVPADQPVGCLGVVTFAGTFSGLPVVVDGDPPLPLGAADITLSARCLGEIRFTGGYVNIRHDYGLEYHELKFHPEGPNGPDWSRRLEVGFNGSPVEAGDSFDLAVDAYADCSELSYSGSQLTQALGRGLGRWGVIAITSGSSTTGVPISGSITDGVAFRYTWEVCGPNSAPCP